MQEFPNRPASLLASIFLRREKAPSLVLVTGERGVGKTAWCLELIVEARQSGIGVFGVVSPPVLDAGQKVGIDLMDVSTGERRRLAMFRQDARQKFAKIPGISTQNWIFDPGVFAWGNQILVHPSPSEFLVLDELGPLELFENKGLIAGLKCIDKRLYQTAYVVIRPSLLSNALERWPSGKVLRVTNCSIENSSK